MSPIDILKQRPALFDLAKRASRLVGRENPLYRRLLRERRLREPIEFLQIGANDGMSCDPIREFVIRGGWSGIAIEPLGPIHARLMRNYARYPRVRTMNCAISYGASRTLTLYCVTEEALARHPGYASMVSSSSMHHLERLLPGITASEIVARTIECVTVEEALARHGMSRVDFLHLDVEGHEANILLNADLAALAASYVLYEHVHLAREEGAAVRARLRALGYELEEFSGDTLAVRSA